MTVGCKDKENQILWQRLNSFMDNRGGTFVGSLLNIRFFCYKDALFESKIWILF